MILSRTRKKILLLPYFKIGYSGAFKVVDADKIDILITNKILDSNCNTMINLKALPSLSIESV